MAGHQQDPEPVSFIPFYDLRRIRYIYQKKKKKKNDGESVPGTCISDAIEINNLKQLRKVSPLTLPPNMARKKHDQRNKPSRKKSDQRNMPGNTINQHRVLSSANTDHGIAHTRNSETHLEKCITEVLHSQSSVNETSERQVDETIKRRLSDNICEDQNMATGSHSIEATSLTNQGPSSGSRDNSRMNVEFPVDRNLMKVKAEPDMEPRTCHTTSIHEPSAHVQHIKVKQEPSSNKTNSALASCGSGVAMDLGSHLHQSLNAPPSSGLTWSQLMEPKNLPKVHETAPTCVKKEKSEPTKESAPMSTHITPTDRAIYPENQHNHRTSASIGGYTPGDMIALRSSFPKTSRRSPPGATTLLSSFPNRFSSNSENSGKIRAGNGTAIGAQGGNILDLSKRSLPPEIRRVLASKYGMERRNEESNPSAMAPNVNKSRSRFTVATRKVAVPEGEESDRKEDIESPPPSMVLIRSQNTYKDQPNTVTTSELSMESSQTIEPNQRVPKIKLSEEFAGSELRTITSVVKNRESSGSPSFQYLTLDYQPTKDSSEAEQLKNQGLLDLGSHYGELLRDTSPNITSRSSSRSPHVDELASRGSPAAQNPSEPMIELGSMQGQRSEHMALRKPGETMIDLLSMEKSGAPRSPSFRVVSFPGKNYRPNFLPGQNYKPSVTIGRPLRRNSSPGLGHPRPSLGPRSNCSASPQYQTLSGGMIDLGSFGKGGDFQDLVSNGASNVMSTPPHVPSGGESRIQKRTHSVSSQEEAILKRSCTERDNERLEKGECGVKLNIVSLLKLEQVEQKYIQDLSVVQSQITSVCFEIDKFQQKRNSLQIDETEIKRNIDVVRSRRVSILRDAQDREGSGSTRETNAQGVTKNEDKMHAVDRQSVFSERRVTHARTSPGFSSGPRSDVSDGYSGETKRMVELVDGVKEDEQDMRRTRRVEGDITDGNQRNPHVVPSEMILLSTHGSGGNSISRYHQHNRKGGDELVQENVGKFEGLDKSLDVFHEKIPAYVEKFEILDDGAENADGTARRLQQDQPSRWQHVNQGSRSVLVEQVDLDSGKDDRLPDESKQFLGCLEISSTTEEPLTTDDGCKEILAEKERELLANSTSSQQGTISSTVQSVLGFDVVTQAGDTAVNSLSEMEFVGHSNAVGFLLPYKGKLFSASADRTTKAFDLKTGECVTSFQGHDGSVNCLQIASDGSNTKDRLFTGSNDQTVRTYDVKSGLCTHKFSFRGRVMCLHIAFGKLFVGLSSGFVAVIDLKTNKCVDQFNCHEPCRISCLSSASEGQRALLCTGSFDSTITIRDQSTGLLLRTITDHKLTVLCMQVVENILFSGSADTIVQSHNINTGQLVRSYSGHSMSVSGLQALGGVLVTSSLDRIIRCFDIKTGDLLQLYGGNSNMIFSLTVFNDMIYTGCKDGRLSGIKLDLRKYHSCKWGDCSLKFGLLSHLKQHVQDHINQTTDIDCCLWGDCFRKFPRMKNQLDINQVAMEHIFSHVSDKET